jgi:hypothetical protein
VGRNRRGGPQHALQSLKDPLLGLNIQRSATKMKPSGKIGGLSKSAKGNSSALI